MAVQHGPILLTGQIGGISFYEMDGKYYARRKTAHSAERIRTDPKFKKTHRNALDFGTASSASKLFRIALSHTLKSFSDTYMAGRMTARFVKIVRTDTSHPHGQRQVPHGDLSLLQGFEFNKHAAFFEASPFSSTAVTIDRPNDEIKLTLHAADHSVTSADAHLVVGITCVNFTKGTHTHHQQKISLATEHTSFIVNTPLNEDPRAAIIITLGLAYSNHHQSNVMAVVAIHQPPAPVIINNKIKRPCYIFQHNYSTRNNNKQNPRHRAARAGPNKIIDRQSSANLLTFSWAAVFPNLHIPSITPLSKTKRKSKRKAWRSVAHSFSLHRCQ